MIARVYAAVIIVAISAFLSYYYIVKPRQDLRAAEVTIKDLKHTGRVDVFETKHQTRKESIKPQGVEHEKINFSPGRHTLTIGR